MRLLQRTPVIDNIRQAVALAGRSDISAFGLLEDWTKTATFALEQPHTFQAYESVTAVQEPEHLRQTLQMDGADHPAAHAGRFATGPSQRHCARPHR